MSACCHTPTTGVHLYAGKLAGGGLLDAACPFSNAANAPNAPGTSRNTPEPAPSGEDTPTFHCPLWPGCGCPGGAMRPECPGLKSRVITE